MSEPSSKRKTEWTERGCRLDVVEWSGGMLMLTCETETVGFKGRQPFFLGRIVVLPFTPRIEAERFVIHCLSYYEDSELVDTAVSVVREFFASIKESTERPMSIPPPPNNN